MTADKEPGKTDFGAEFSEDRNYRYALWRIWDRSKPLVMFIGLNPSTANETDNDPTIKSVCRIAKHNGYGGVYMMNCFPYVSTNPKELFNGISPTTQELNNLALKDTASICQDVVFAWGNFKEVEPSVVNFLNMLFPNAKALQVNKNGSPKHPLYCKSTTELIPFNQKLQSNE
jgi:hypothetical protein